MLKKTLASLVMLVASHLMVSVDYAPHYVPFMASVADGAVKCDDCKSRWNSILGYQSAIEQALDRIDSYEAELDQIAWEIECLPATPENQPYLIDLLDLYETILADIWRLDAFIDICQMRIEYGTRAMAECSVCYAEN